MPRVRAVTRDILQPQGARWQEVSATEASQLPYAAIASLRLHIVTSTKTQVFFAGTGWFIAPNAVVTAAHVTDVEKAWNTVASPVSWHIEAVPGLARGARPFGETWALRVVRHPQWSGISASDFDVAAVIVTPLAAAGNQFLRAEPWPATALEAPTVSVAGYPFAQFRGETPVRHEGPVRVREGNCLFYDIDTEDGQSGAPVLFDAGGSRPVTVVGIHSAGQGLGTSSLARSLNVGVALRSELLEWIDSVVQSS